MSAATLSKHDTLASVEGASLLNASLELNQRIPLKQLHSLIFAYANLNFESRVNSEMHRLLNAEKWIYPLTSRTNQHFFEHFAPDITCLELSSLALSEEVSLENLYSVATSLNKLTTLTFKGRGLSNSQRVKCQRLVQGLPITRLSFDEIELPSIKVIIATKALTHIQINGTFLYSLSINSVHRYENEFHMIFSDCSNLVELSLNQRFWGGAIGVKWDSLWRALQTMPNLTVLRLTNYDYLPTQSKSFISSLATLNHLQTLDISDIPLQYEDIKQLNTFRFLEVLCMKRCCFAEDQLNSVNRYQYDDNNSLDGFNLFTAVKEITTLREFDVTGCRLSYQFFINVVLIRNLEKLICGGAYLPRRNYSEPPHFCDKWILRRAQLENPRLQIEQIPNRFWPPPRHYSVS